MIRMARIITGLAMSATLFLVPFAANAEDLNISNHTSYDLSFAFNLKCATEFGNVTARTIRSLPEAQFNANCKNRCEISVYDAVDCGGQLVAKFIYDTRNQYVDVYSTGIHKIDVAVSGFYNLFFSQSYTG